ncbi:hypothetical protein PFICI_09579 [Pestalotiopsis fici W106-1]|uniref:Fluoride export protein 1 n=1 Tax=Pestalotiopsis fici (strain W106-1 / CGMCC3.15140) TaxID=1229662 RepID=W3X3L6_PESFW|nr:uncharacterized protein PFICI_09579 [Pestalotiopsis fici W106-1]ETS79726.1 hypothetical protein PFICI_09579 [Pestalotiopsis fici W106-1]
MPQSWSSSSRKTNGSSNRDHELSSIPETWRDLSEIEAPAPVQNPDESAEAEYKSLEDEVSSQRRQSCRSQGEQDSSRGFQGRLSEHMVGSGQSLRWSDDVADAEEGYTAPPEVANLTEAIPDAVVDNPQEDHRYSHHSLEEELGQTQAAETPTSRRFSRVGRSPSQEPPPSQNRETPTRKGRVATGIYLFSHLVFFSILGTLARLGLTALTTYPTDVIRYGSIWPNFAGTFIIGFLSEGAELWHHPAASRSIARPAIHNSKESLSPGHDTAQSGESVEAAMPAVNKPNVPIPLHIGLATGFCGSLTSFSAFMRDCFDALSGILVSSSSQPSPGRDFMSVAAVFITTLGLCAAALKAGAHTAILLKMLDKRFPRRLVHWADRIVLVLGTGCWAAAIIMCVVPPDRFRAPETWRGEALFAIAFAPVGCLLRFILSIKLNARIVGFPLGTFCVNMLGTLILSVVWDLQRIPKENMAIAIGTNLLSCQVLQGIEDGFCGCLTTVSTFILELNSLRRRHAYCYGVASLLTGLAVVVTIMGSLKWTVGLSQPVCTSL